MEEEKNKFDEIFSTALKDFKEEPSPGVWNNIKGALPVNPVSKGIFNRYFINTAAAVIVVSALIFTAYHFYNKANLKTNNTTAHNNSPAETKNALTINSNHITTANDQNNAQIPSKPSDNAYSSENSSSQSAINKPANAIKQQPSVSKPAAVVTNNKETKVEAIASNNISKPEENIKSQTSDQQTPATRSQTSASSLQSQASSIQSPASELLSPTSNIITPSSDLLLPASNIRLIKIKPLFSRYISSADNETYPELAVPLSEIYPHKIFNPDYYISINYTPEYFISHSKLFSAKADFANTTDLSLTLSWRRLILRTGVGLSLYNTDKYNYTVNYAKNQNLGTYSKVDSVTFSLVNNVVVPKYYTSTVTVYNQVNQIYQSQVDKKYAYLQIPFIVGYSLNDMNRLTFTVNAGPVLSLTMFKKAGEIMYPDNADEIINVQTNEVSRVSSYWDMLVSLGINYRLTGRLSLNIEPQYRTSLGSVYTESNPQLKKPYSVGLRSGIMFKL